VLNDIGMSYLSGRMAWKKGAIDVEEEGGCGERDAERRGQSG